MRAKTGHAVLEHELLAEQAATITRLAEALRNALDALAGFEQRPSTAKMSAERRALKRSLLVDAAANALWHFVVQRDCAGFRFTEQALEEFAVPAEVRAKLGAIRPR